jgi:pseudouridine-5'-phosphate glycosidase
VRVADEVAIALDSGVPVVALETAVVTHGLPRPQNVRAIQSMADAVRLAGAVPAICLVQHGQLWVGATPSEADAAADDPRREKASVRDLAEVLAKRVPAGLTVSATLLAAELTGVRVFATGGIGGVHVPADSGDVSADLTQLARSPVITVCSGAKSVLDIPRTLEALETLGVPVLGYRTDTFPAFVLESSGEGVDAVKSCDEVVQIARLHWSLGLRTSLIVANPIPSAHAIASLHWNEWLETAQDAARGHGIRGKAVTPYLLDRLATLSGGMTVTANLALLENNARVAGEIAARLSR